MEIRKMRIEDYGTVYALWSGCPGVGLNSIDDSPEGFERYLRRNPDTCFLAEEDGRVIGTILACDDGRRGHINHPSRRTAAAGAWRENLRKRRWPR